MEENFQGNLKNKKIRSKPKLNLNQPKSSLIKLPQYFPFVKYYMGQTIVKRYVGYPIRPCFGLFQQICLLNLKRTDKSEKRRINLLFYISLFFCMVSVIKSFKRVPHAVPFGFHVKLVELIWFDFNGYGFYHF